MKNEVMERLNEVKENKLFRTGLIAGAISVITSLPVWANEGSGTVDIASTIGTAATNAATQANSVITTLVPIVMGVVTTVVVVTLGIRLFKRFMKG